jgi:hypothetical protein
VRPHLTNEKQKDDRYEKGDKDHWPRIDCGDWSPSVKAFPFAGAGVCPPPLSLVLRHLSTRHSIQSAIPLIADKGETLCA